MLTFTASAACLLIGYMVGLYGFTKHSDHAFKRLLAAQGRAYFPLPEDTQ